LLVRGIDRQVMDGTRWAQMTQRHTNDTSCLIEGLCGYMYCAVEAALDVRYRV
jgi:hypothetical protein